MKVAIVGAGIAGVSIAYFLAKKGASVTIFERERNIASKASYANGSQISVSNSEVWTTYSNIKKGIKWMFDSKAPLLIRPKPSFDKLKWLLHFLNHTIEGKYEENTIKTINMALKSRSLIQDIIKNENLDIDFSKSGILHFYKDQKYFDQAIDVRPVYQSQGAEWKILDPKQTIKIEPTLADTRNLLGGIYTSDDCVGDMHKFCLQLSDKLVKEHNVQFKFLADIKTLDDLKLFDNFDKFVLANGVGVPKLAKTFGDKVNIYPVKGYSVTIDLDKNSYDHAPNVSLLDDQKKIVCSKLGNKLRVAGTAELDGENYDIRRDRIEPLLDWVHENFPNINTDNYRSWACLRPMTPNMMPIVGPSKNNSRVYYHAGHGHLGWTIGCGTAKVLSEEILNG